MAISESLKHFRDIRKQLYYEGILDNVAYSEQEKIRRIVYYIVGRLFFYRKIVLKDLFLLVLLSEVYANVSDFFIEEVFTVNLNQYQHLFPFKKFQKMFYDKEDLDKFLKSYFAKRFKGTNGNTYLRGTNRLSANMKKENITFDKLIKPEINMKRFYNRWKDYDYEQ